MRIAIVGTGYVCDMYLASLPRHPGLDLVGVYDTNPDRAQSIAQSAGAKQYRSLEELVADPSVEIVVNLTNPASHFEVSQAAILGGKHVYTEKPLALDLDQARELVRLAEDHGVELSGAPCSLLGESAQTIRRELRADRIGPVRLVYAELDDGPVPLLPIDTWRSTSGFGWPYVDEFETGCTVEHAGYYLPWLLAFFGPVRRMSAFSAITVPNKPGMAAGAGAPDFSVGCLEFDAGVVARLTNGLLAPRDHSLTIVGDEGLLELDDCWDYQSPVRFSKHALRPKLQRFAPIARLLGYGPSKVPLVDDFDEQSRRGEMMDYCRGIAALANTVQGGAPLELSAEMLLHITEITLTLQHPERMGSPRTMQTTFGGLR